MLFQSICRACTSPSRGGGGAPIDAAIADQACGPMMRRYKRYRRRSVLNPDRGDV